MRAQLTFKLPEEEHEFALANKAGKLYGAAWDFAQLLRGKRKYTDEKPGSWSEVEQLFNEHFEGLLE